MNDYLWDKSGDADPEIQQLEDLLGTLRYQQRPLSLPSEAETRKPASTRFAYRRPAFAAVAAALLLMLLAGLWLAARRHALQMNDASSVAQTTNTAQGATEKLESTPPIASAAQKSETNKILNAQVSDVLPKATSQARLAGGAPPLGRPKAVRPDRAVREAKQESTQVAVAVAPRESRPALTFITAEQQKAKEQLMLALRLASMKLNIAQRRTHTMPEQKITSDERNRIR